MSMRGRFKSKRARSLLLAVSVFAIVAVMVACAPQSSNDQAGSDTADATATPAANEHGVIIADSWQDLYPHEYSTFMDNLDNNTEGAGVFEPRGDMLEMYPQIEIVWAGNPFTKSYFEPNGHNYSLEDITATGRITEKSLANCITCKSADFTAMYQQQGVAIMSQPFAQVIEEVSEPISCYNCHENDPETLAVTQAFFVEALGDDAASIPVSAQVCGQCHNEYYFNPDTKAVTNPYTDLASMTPEGIYQYYQDRDFSDSVNEISGVSWIKVQHPEFEFVYSGSGSSMSQRINSATGERYSCADCHMGNEIQADDGVGYRSHLLVSPLENEELLKTCNIGSGCHTDLATQVADWQAESEGKVQSVGDKLVELTNAIGAQKDTLEADVLQQVNALNREGLFYWEFVMVENSEGAHNPELSNACLDRANELVDQALAMLGQ